MSWLDLDDVPPGGGDPADWRPSLKQAQAMHISAKAAGMGKGDVAMYCWLWFGKYSTKDLTWGEYRKLADWIERSTEYGAYDD